MHANAGKLHIFYGSGKGKTTAAVGLAVRAAGRRQAVCFVQFLKDGCSGELEVLRKIPQITVLEPKYRSKKFVFQMRQTEKERLTCAQTALLQEAFALCSKESYRLLILDEVLDALQTGTLDADAFRTCIQQRPDGLELVCTGHELPETLAHDADYITEMRKVKHPFDQGLSAREGIEY